MDEDKIDGRCAGWLFCRLCLAGGMRTYTEYGTFILAKMLD